MVAIALVLVALTKIVVRLFGGENVSSSYGVGGDFQLFEVGACAVISTCFCMGEGYCFLLRCSVKGPLPGAR